MDGTVPALAELYLLKKKYAFVIYCDEAHSFLSIGSGGRGCLELWNDENPDAMLPDDLIDIRTATLSKAVGGLGGVVFGAARFADAVRSRSEHLHKRGHESVSASTLVQSLYVLGQPQRLRRQLHHLRHMTIFCKKELQRFGVHVYGDAATPILPVHAGRPTLSCKLSYKLRQLGVLATPINVPAVKFWESRVRVTLSADFSDDQVNKLLDSIIEASHSVGITKRVKLQRLRYKYAGCDVAASNEEEEEHRTCVRNIHALIQKDSASQGSHHSSSTEAFTRNCGNAVIQTGHISRARYGLGSSGSRWVSGTFSSHLALERLLAATGGREAAMTFADAEFGLSSSIAALCRPLLGYKKHYLLVPATAHETVREGLRIASKRDMPEVVEYDDMDDLYATLNQLSRRTNTYFTIYIETVTTNNTLINLPLILENLQKRKGPSSGMTLLLDDTHGLGHHGPKRLGILGALNRAAATRSLDANAQILVYGSFHQAFGLSGGYLAGDEVLISELRYTSRGYMYSTSPQPFVMDMVGRALRGRIDDPDE
jgi:serine palmitoyltransferase